MVWKLIKARSPRHRRGLVLSVLAVVCVVGIASWVVYGTAAFAVTEVKVRGTTFTDEADVRDAAKVVMGSSIVAIDADEVAQRVTTVPEVAAAAVSRDWPHTIVVDVTERSPHLAVPAGKKFTLVDDSGVAFRTVSKVPPKTTVVLLEEPGRSDPATAAVLTVLSALTPELLKDLVKIDGKVATQIGLELNDSRTVFWGDASNSDRKAEVATALLSLDEQHFDVSAPDVPTVS